MQRQQEQRWLDQDILLRVIFRRCRFTLMEHKTTDSVQETAKHHNREK